MSDLGWTSKYVGIPYLRHGRSTRGADCWGLVRLAMDEHFGTMLPDYSDEYPTQADAVRAIGEHSAHMEMVTDFQRPGDLVLMNVGNSPCHVGLLVGSDYILHADPFGKQPSRLERISRAIKLRIEGYYRVC